MQIIKAEKHHLDALSEFFDKVVMHLENHINYPKWIRGEYPARASIATAIQNDTQYICIEDDKILGAFILNTDPQGYYENGDWSKDLALGEFMVLHTLATDPDIYKGGVGRFMVEYCIKKAEADGFSALRLDVVPGNKPAIGLYEKLGFKFAGRKNIGRFEDNIPLFDLYEYNF